MAVLDYAGLQRYDGKIKTYTGDLVDTVVEVTDTEPSDQYNKIWVDVSDDEYEIAEMSDVDVVKNGFNGSLAPGVITGWEKGSFDTTNGSNYSSDTRIRNQTKVGYSTGVCRFVLNSGYSTVMFAWDLSGAYVGAYKTDGTWTKTTSGWKNVTEFDLSTVPNYVIKFSVARVPSSSDIEASEGDQVVLYNYTDKTLTQENKAADAATCGMLQSALTALETEGWQELPFTIASGYINPDTGSVTTSDASSHTDYIDISNFSKIKFKRRGSTLSTVASGSAFYNSSKTYISRSGLKDLASQEQTGYFSDLCTVNVPSGAAYFRATVFNDTTTYGNFEVYGISKLGSDVSEVIDITNITPINYGKFITGTGTKSTNDAGRMTDSIPLKSGEKIVVDYDFGTTVSIGVIAKVNGENSYTVLVGNGGSATKKHFEYIATADINVVVSSMTYCLSCVVTKYGISKLIVDYDNIRNVPDFAKKSDLPVEVSTVSLRRENGYRNTSGGVTGSTTTYFNSTFALLAGEKIVVDYQDVAAPVVVLGIFDSQEQFTIIKVGTATPNRKTVSYKAMADVTVSVSGYGSDFDTFKVTKIIENAVVIKELVAATADDYYDVLSSKVPWEYALDKVLCIGDSLTYGAPPNTSTMPNPMKQNYPWYLSRMIETEVTNAGKSGYETSRWYTECYDDYTMSNYNAIIIFLGTNGNLTDTLDTDVDPYEDYNDFAETQTGYYCKLIKHIQADNSNAIIFLVNVWSVASGADTTREVIDKIGAKYSLPVIETYDLRYAVNPVYHGNNDNVHMTKAGYLALAHRVCNTVRDYIDGHKSLANVGMTT